MEKSDHGGSKTCKILLLLLLLFLNQKKHPAKGIVSAVIAVSLLAA